MAGSGLLYYANSGGEGSRLENTSCNGTDLPTDRITENQKDCHGKAKKKKKVPLCVKYAAVCSSEGRGQEQALLYPGLTAQACDVVSYIGAPHLKDTARVEMFDFSLKVVNIFHSGALQTIQPSLGLISETRMTTLLKT